MALAMRMVVIKDEMMIGWVAGYWVATIVETMITKLAEGTAQKWMASRIVTTVVAQVDRSAVQHVLMKAAKLGEQRVATANLRHDEQGVSPVGSSGVSSLLGMTAIRTLP